MVQIRVGEDGLIVQQLLYADEVRSVADLHVETVAVSGAELSLAEQLIEQNSVEGYDPAEYTDEEKQRIRAQIDKMTSSAPPETLSWGLLPRASWRMYASTMVNCFRDLVILRMAAALRQSHISAGRIRESLLRTKAIAADAARDGREGSILDYRADHSDCYAMRPGEWRP